MSNQPQVVSEDHSFFGHPKALATLAGVEMWERFSFYGMQGILLIYMYYTASRGGLGMDETVAAGIVGAYGGAVYLSTILGGWIADRVFGSERTLYYSAWLIMVGHVALAALPGFIGLTVGLIFIAFGSGGLKANATAVVGTLYGQEDTRRDAGFSIFYMGINVGALLGPLLTGILQSEVGFHWGFGAAAIGMAAGLLQYHFGRRNLPAQASEIANPLTPEARKKFILMGVGLVAVIAIAVVSGLITAKNLSTIVIAVTVIATIIYFIVILGSKGLTSDERSRMFGFIPLFLASVAFWSLYQQQFTVLTLYSDKELDRMIFGWEMPVSWVQSINPVFIILLSGVFAAVWTKLGERQPSTPVKFAVGTALMGGAFLLFLPTAGGAANSTPLLWMVVILFVFTIAELFLSPVGLSVATKLAPHMFKTQMVSLWFLSVALGTAISGQLAALYTHIPARSYFGVLGLIAIGLGVALALATKPILKAMRGVR